MNAQKGRPSRLPPNADIAAELRAGATVEGLAAKYGVSKALISIRLNDAGWGSDGRPNHKSPKPLATVPLQIFEWPPWVDRALCAQTDPEAFFPEKGGSTRQAKAVCAQCPVRLKCLQWALDNDERFGVYGGLSERDRRKLKKAAS